MSDICGDNRFEIIEAYKRELIEATNIESSPEEMAVIDNVLFRFWQMGWLSSAKPTQTNTSNTLGALATRWIPMTEREPEPYTTVLITIRTRYNDTEPWGYYTDVADYHEYDWNMFNDWDEGQEYYITAWMPLPQPWEGADDE